MCLLTWRGGHRCSSARRPWCSCRHGKTGWRWGWPERGRPAHWGGRRRPGRGAPGAWSQTPPLSCAHRASRSGPALKHQAQQSVICAPALHIQASHCTLGMNVVQNFHRFQHEASWGNGLTILQSGHATVWFCFVLKSKAKHYLRALLCWHYTCIICYTYTHRYIYEFQINLGKMYHWKQCSWQIYPHPRITLSMRHLMTASFDACSKRGCFYNKYFLLPLKIN